MKTIKGTTTFDVTVEYEWEIEVPDHVTSDQVYEATRNIMGYDAFESELVSYLDLDPEDITDDDDTDYESMRSDVSVTIHGRNDEVQDVDSDITDDGEDN